MDETTLEQLAYWQVYQEHVNRFRRGARPGAKLEDCNCPTMWMSILPPPPCPYHGQAEMLTVTC